jgi:hypothetical protein
VGQAYWSDLGERVASTAIYGVITMLTADASGAISGRPEQWWVIVGLPTSLSLLKGVLVNLKGVEPTASVVNVTSDGALTDTEREADRNVRGE